MPAASFLLRQDARTTLSKLVPAGPMCAWALSNRQDAPPGEEVVLWFGPFTDSDKPGFSGLFKASDLDLVQPMSVEVGPTSQRFTAARSIAVEISVPAGARVRYRVGAAGERATRDSESALIVGPVELEPTVVNKPADEVLYLVADEQQAGMVPVELAFVIFRPAA